MKRHDAEWLSDIVEAIAAINHHLTRGGLDDGLVFDAVRLRLIEIGEVVKRVDPAILATEPEIPWEDVAGMRDRLAHRYFDTSHAIVAATVDQDLPNPLAGVLRLQARPGTSRRPAPPRPHAHSRRWPRSRRA